MDLRASTRPLSPHEGIERLARFPFALLTWVDADGFPMSAAVQPAVDIEGDTATFALPAGFDIPVDALVSLTGSHIRPQPGFGYDERRHVTVWGPLGGADGEGGMLAAERRLRAERAWGWDEAEVPFPEYVERTVGQSRSYYERLSEEQGRPVRPRLGLGWLTLRATRLPFLSATLIPVSVGLAIAATEGSFDLFTALVTIVGAAAVHLGLNVANDVFDTRLGADDANVRPTQFSGGSRVIQYGLVSLRRMSAISLAMYAVAIACGLILLAVSFSWALLVIGLLGIVLSVGYTAPPLKLVYRGWGELTTAVGFGPLMLVGAYVVQSGGSISMGALAASVPIAILVALILYVNEIPDRESDARAGKRTLPVILGKATVVALYGMAVVVAFGWVVLAVISGWLPVPALLVLLAVPLAWRVFVGIQASYDQAYALMPVMATNIRLHLVTGVVLFLAYVAVIAVGALAPDVDLFLG
jgi:1,4-dihydroxy-2-naphthoate polyprenyltransferase